MNFLTKNSKQLFLKKLSDRQLNKIRKAIYEQNEELNKETEIIK